MTLFQQLRLDRGVSQLLAERTLLARSVQRCVVREVSSKKKQTAELFVKNAEDGGADEPRGSFLRTIVMQVCPASLLNPEQFFAVMRCELLQIADMIDERFAYEKDSLRGRLPRENLIRDRYRVLWDAYAQGRLAGQGHANKAAIAQLPVRFQRVFAIDSAQLVQPAVRRVFEAGHLTHDQLLHWAQSPGDLFQERGNAELDSTSTSGEPCPVCGCSTFDWYELKQEDDSTIEAVQCDFPHWQPDQGICRQCAEIYAGIHTAQLGDPAI